MNKIILKQNKKKEWYAVIKSRNGRQVWNTQPAGVTSKRTLLNAIKLLSRPFKVVEEVESSNITG